MWAINGMFTLPKNPDVQSVPTPNGKGHYINFKSVTQGKGGGDAPIYQYWECAMWVPTQDLDNWLDKLQPGQVFLVEHGNATSYPIMDGKYHPVKIRLDFNKIRHMAVPMWAQKKG